MDSLLRKYFNKFLGDFFEPLGCEDLQLSFTDGIILRDLVVKNDSINKLLEKNKVDLRVEGGRVGALRLCYTTLPGVVTLQVQDMDVRVRPNALRTVGRQLGKAVSNILHPPEGDVHEEEGALYRWEEGRGFTYVGESPGHGHGGRRRRSASASVNRSSSRKHTRTGSHEVYSQVRHQGYPHADPRDCDPRDPRDPRHPCHESYREPPSCSHSHNHGHSHNRHYNPQEAVYRAQQSGHQNGHQSQHNGQHTGQPVLQDRELQARVAARMLTCCVQHRHLAQPEDVALSRLCPPGFVGSCPVCYAVGNETAAAGSGTPRSQRLASATARLVGAARDQTRADQTRADQTRADQTRADQTESQVSSSSHLVDLSIPAGQKFTVFRRGEDVVRLSPRALALVRSGIHALDRNLDADASTNVSVNVNHPGQTQAQTQAQTFASSPLVDSRRRAT